MEPCFLQIYFSKLKKKRKLIDGFMSKKFWTGKILRTMDFIDEAMFL